ncbi:MAG: hypothetical protein HW416_905 [Chloroflexi bacterium]|nr:hypothetical protein [Chloroflexota bacterium]
MESYPEAPERVQVRPPGTLIFFGALVVVFFLVAGAVDFTTEWLWFNSLGVGSVFVTSIYARFAAFLAGFVVFLVLFTMNVLIARKLAYGFERPARRSTVGGAWEELLAQVGAQMARQGDYSRLINGAVLAGGVVLAIFMGLLAAGNWLLALQFLNRTQFDVADPAFGQDVAFYVFAMPMLRAVEGWLFTTLVLVVVSVAAVYAVVLTYELAVNIGQAGFRLSQGMRRHLLGLAAAGFLLLAYHHALDLFDLVRSTRGVAFGAGYADMHAQAPAQMVLAAVAVLASLLCLVNIGTVGIRLAAIGGGLWAASLIVVGWAFPSAMQAFDVTPNQLDRERPYIANNIEFTRRGFGLDRIEEQDIAFEDAVPSSAVVTEQATINNIRLWDPQPLLATYNQIQAIRQYYQFHDVDVDRYTINGDYQQVMIGARELVPENLPREAQSWVSRQLQYTHGYGVAMNRVNVISQEGLPSLTIRDVPPVGPIPITRPEIYFGERTDQYVITRTAAEEFDYPRGDGNVFANYAGTQGIPIGSGFDRLLFAIKFQDPYFLLNDRFLPDSLLLYRRNVSERAQQIAPFLRLDPDPYVVIADGALYWIQDAYTTTDRFPYSQPHQPTQVQRGARPRPFNYIRNSVKIVTSAYDGSIRYYVTDPSDPLIQTYRRVFPELFLPQEQAPASIRAHFRYPEEIYKVQTEVYRQYHVQDPRVFYLREDVWSIPNELFYDQKQPVQPYYVIMRLPGEPRPEFALIMPFVPSGRDNMIGWLAARSDEPNYGRLFVYKYPKDKLIFGPFQIETRIDQDPVISAQFSLWNQAGSQVIRGNLLVIPIGQSNLYVEPIYLQATQSPLPELKRVIVSTGNRIVMEPTLEEGIARLLGTGPIAGQQPAPTTTLPGATQPPSGAPQLSQTVAQIAAEAQDRYSRAQEALRAGDFARYGEEIRQLEAILNRLVQQTR